MVRKSPSPGQANPLVDARQATKAAFDYFEMLFSNKIWYSEPGLEEIEMTKDGQFWLVTLGYDAPRPQLPHLPEFLQVPMRKLKVFKVDAATGRVLSMKIPHGE